MKTRFEQLIDPTAEIIEQFNVWENDPLLIPFLRPNRDQAALASSLVVTEASLKKRMARDPIYLIYADDQLVGEMNFQIDPEHLFKKEAGTAWIGINIGEAFARGQGVGAQAMLFLEECIQTKGLSRIELGVFEFNRPARKLYQKLGYQEIGRIADFTFWQGRMWQDIRMEKHLKKTGTMVEV